MSLRSRVLKGVAVLGAGQAIGQGLSFVRNLVVARLLKPEDFGVAATFAITLALLEAISDLSADKLIVQAKDGDDPELEQTAQLWLFIRGLCLAAVVAVLAWPLASLFKVPQARSAFCWLALVPLLRGCVHLDLKRLHRKMRYGPQVMSEIGAQVISAAAAWPLARFIGDYWAMLWLVIAQSAVLVILSHTLAERPFRWAWNRENLARLLSFGWPLLLNGLLMFGIFQGDRLVVGTGYTIHELGIYSVAGALAVAPTAILSYVAASLMLPLFSEAQHVAPLLRARYVLAVQLLSLAGGLVGVVLIVLAEWLLGSLYGQRYLPAAGTFCWLVAAESVRLIRLAPTLVALSRSDSHNSLYANLWRILALPLAIGVASFHWSIELVAACGFIAELFAVSASALRVRRHHQLGLRPLIQAVVVPGIAVLVASMIRGASHVSGLCFGLLTGGGLCLTLLLCMVVCLSPLRAELMYMLAATRRRLLPLAA